MSPRRITLVTSQLLGFDNTGGVGSATTFLTLALARMGHDVDVVYTQEQLRQPLDGDWARRYEDVGAAIRVQPALATTVDPPWFGRMRAVELALRADPPDVVIAHEYGAPAYIALRQRHLGLAFEGTSFVTYCHGTGRWLKEMTGNPRVPTEMLAHGRLEQAVVELADLVVSPSAYMLDWMRRQQWRLPEARVIPLVTRRTAMDEPASRPADANGNRPVERLVFFGRLHTMKGVEPFVGGLNELAPELLDGIELEFLGGPTKDWDPERVTAVMSERTVSALRRLSFETDLGPREALERLSRPGTLAVMPSLAENSPNVVYECLEAGIPFLASASGGIGELVAAEDRPRVLFQPTTEGVAAALRRVLGEREVLRPVQPAFDGAEVLRAWSEAVTCEPQRVPGMAGPPAVDVVVHERGSEGALERCLTALAAQTYGSANVIRASGTSVTAAREEGLRHGAAEWVIFLDEDDVPDPDFVGVLVRAQAASGADVVSCAIRRDGGEHFFVGEPGGPGVLANGYGTVSLLRRSRLGDLTTAWPTVGDHDWPLLARLNAEGAHVVSVPLPLVSRVARPGTVEHEPTDALLVVEALERALPDQARFLARLVAGLAAKKPEATPGVTSRGRARRLLRSVVDGKPRGQARGAS